MRVFLLLVGVLVLVLVAALVFNARSSEVFPVQSYLAAPANYVGNVYEFDGTIQQALARREGVGRLLVVRENGGAELALFLPENLRQNVEFGQRYRFEIGVAEGGRLDIQSLRKL
jgi:hypothetical protein